MVVWGHGGVCRREREVLELKHRCSVYAGMISRNGGEIIKDPEQ